MKLNRLFKGATLGLALIAGISLSNAQCPGGQVEVTMDVNTDAWAYEIYWEIVPTGNACGVGTIASGGSTVVGCAGGAAQVQNTGAGYQNNNSTYNEGPWCLIDGACYDIIFVDDWGDGGGDFDVFVNGFNIGNFVSGSTGNATLTFCAAEPLAYDAGVQSLTSPYVNDEVGMKDVVGSLFNYGGTTITSLDLTYQIDGNTPVTANLTGLNIANATAYSFTHPTQWNATLGNYTLKVWTSNLNGNSDMDATNDTLTTTIDVGPGLPNIIDTYLGQTPVITQIVNSSDQVSTPSDLDFHPDYARKELWVVNKGVPTNSAQSPTNNIGSSMVIINDAGEPTQTDVFRKDQNAKHFMNSTTGIAFSKNGNWGNSPGVYDANFSGGTPFTGPSLWSSDMAIFAVPNGGNGSHLDMLHASSYAQGIAWEQGSAEGNVFWIFDGNNNDICRYDFVVDHGPGNSYHDDGMIYRYGQETVAKDPNNKVSSHMVISGDWLYVVDYGNQRIFRQDITTGTVGGAPTYGPMETLAAYNQVTGYTTEPVVSTGLVEPCGIDVIEDRMIVSDYNTGEVIIYDITSMPATELGRITTGAQGIMGIKIGPLGKIWYVDYDANTVNRIDGNSVGVEESILNTDLSIFPNPAKNNFSINLKGVLSDNINVNVFDVTGKLVYTTIMTKNTIVVNTENWVNGIYQVHLSNNASFSTEKIVIQH